MTEMNDEEMITSKDIIEQTGISRATLNNYIKMGILPKPLVRRPERNLGGIKQIGYFPKKVLDTIKQVKRFKQEGDSMEEIARELGGSATTAVIPPKQPRDETTPLQQPTLTPFPGKKADPGRLTLTIDKMEFPALLVNHSFEIEWINHEAEEQIFHRSVSRITELESRNLFKLLFSWEFSSHLENWEEAIAHHLPFVKSGLPKEHISGLYPGISESETRFLENIYDEETPLSGENVHCAPLNLVAKDGSAASYQMHSMCFREGIFFAYVPTDRMVNDVMEMLSQRGRIITELLRHRMPSLVSLCVLVADLQDSVKISAELLPEEYFELINQLWKALQVSFERYDGIYGKHAGDGMLYYFIKKPGSGYVKNALDCASEIKEKMKEFSNEWKLRKGWLNDLYLNIGINEGQEFFGTVHSASHVEFTALGDSINYAGRLSDFARFGSIWTTKNVISQLDQEDLEQIQFGVRRRQHDREIFVKNTFSRVIDLVGNDEEKSSKFLDIATMPVTEILSCEPRPQGTAPEEDGI